MGLEVTGPEKISHRKKAPTANQTAVLCICCCCFFSLYIRVVVDCKDPTIQHSMLEDTEKSSVLTKAGLLSIQQTK